jgi:uncharacterized membrane protein YraQ (UPF0718 family)
MIVLHALVAGLLQALHFLWDSLFGLSFGFLISAIVQVVLTPGTMHRYLGPNLRGILFGAGFGIISSSCSYGSAAAARGFYQRGADIRAVFSFLISSTNMNVAILILFWSLLGWKFAFAEFFGGIIIIAVVATGFSVLFGARELERLRLEHPSPISQTPAMVTECPICGMEGARDFAVEYQGRTYLACGRKHYEEFAGSPGRYVGDGDEAGVQSELTGWKALASTKTWRAIGATAMNDVGMLRTELAVGYLLAGFADLLVPPLIAIYGKSFPPSVTRAFVGFFIVGAMAAGAVMEFAIGSAFGGISMGSMVLNDRLTSISNVVGIVAVLLIVAAARSVAASDGKRTKSGTAHS